MTGEIKRNDTAAGHKRDVSLKALGAGILVLLVFSYAAGGFASSARGFSAGSDAAREGVPLGSVIEEGVQEELRRLEGTPLTVRIAGLIIMLAGVWLSGFVAARIAQRRPVLHGVILGAAYALFLVVGTAVLILRFEFPLTRLWVDGLQALFSVPLAAWGACIASSGRRASPPAPDAAGPPDNAEKEDV